MVFLPWLVRGAIAVGGYIIGKAVTSAGVTAGSAALKMLRFGEFVDEIVVTVVGAPNSTKAELYKVAVAAAFGKVPRYSPELFGLNPAPGMMYIQYNAEEHMVQFLLRYEHSGAMLIAARASGGGGFAGTVDTLPLFAGPKDTTIGGPSTFNIPGLPDLSDKWSGRTILTNEATCADPDPSFPAFFAPSVNTPVPRPPGDYRSRGTLVSMVTNALTNPDGTNLQSWPRPTDATKFTGG